MINQNTVLQGQIVGIGKIHKDGSEEFKWLEKPIHNNVTSAGIDNLLMWNGSDALPTSNLIKECASLWTPVSNRNGGRDTGAIRTGVLYYSAYGDGRGTTQLTDIDLKHKLSDYTTSFKSGEYFCGSNAIFGENQQEVQFRVTHIHAAAPENHTVWEIGWFHKVEPSGNYTMFSRVQLDKPIELATGDQLVITYQLNVKYAKASYINDFFGLLDKDGNTLQAQITTSMYLTGSRYNGTGGPLNWVNHYNDEYSSPSSYTYPGPRFPSIIAGSIFSRPLDQERGYGYQWSIYGCCPIWTSTLSYDSSTLLFGLKSDYNLNRFDHGGPTDGSSDVVRHGVSLSPQVASYTPGSGYRDVTITVPAFWPNLNGASDYIDLSVLFYNGVAYRFGYIDNGTWVPQQYRKYGDKMLRITFRHSYTAGDSSSSNT